MRELKFRFWNKIAQRFQPASKYAIDGKGDLVAYDYEMRVYDDAAPFSRTCIVAQQYTGLKDKNGVEIYEGDFVEIIYGENLVGEVYFQSNMGTFRVKCNDENSYPLVTYNIEANKLINVVEKVIGNIYEPPELVEQIV